MKSNCLFTTLLALTVSGSCIAEQTVLVDFGIYAAQSSAETDPNGYHWNNVAPSGPEPVKLMGWETLTQEQQDAGLRVYEYAALVIPYVVVDDLVDTTGAATGSQLIFSDYFRNNEEILWGGFLRAGSSEEFADDLGAFPTQTGYPVTATVDSWAINWGVNVGFTLTGLDDSSTYTLKFYGAQAKDDWRASWTVQGETKSITTFLNYGEASDDYAVFENVQPEAGEIIVYYSQGPDAADKENGNWSVMEITGNFDGSSQANWNGIPVDAEGWVDTDSWIGWINVMLDPWIWSVSFDKYVYATDDSGWLYVPR